MMLLCCCSPTPPTSVWKDIIPLVSPIVVIILFIIDRYLGFVLRRKEVERNWYLKVLIEPSLSKISMFFNSVLVNYSNSAKNLGSKRGVAHITYISLKSKEFGVFQKLKRDFEAEVVYPIQLRYPRLGEQLTNSLLSLEDTYTRSLDNENFEESHINDFQKYTAQNRASFLVALYSPLSRKGSR